MVAMYTSNNATKAFGPVYSGINTHTMNDVDQLMQRLMFKVWAGLYAEHRCP